MTKQKYRDELIAKVAKLEQQVQRQKDADKELREELSEALDARRMRAFPYSDPESTTYSWEQIFVQIGRLTERKKQTDLETKVSSLWNNYETISDQLNHFIRESQSDRKSL